MVAKQLKCENVVVHCRGIVAVVICSMLTIGPGELLFVINKLLCAV